MSLNQFLLHHPQDPQLRLPQDYQDQQVLQQPRQDVQQQVLHSESLPRKEKVSSSSSLKELYNCTIKNPQIRSLDFIEILGLMAPEMLC